MSARRVDDVWLGLDQTAEALGVSVRTVQNMARRGELERRQTGRRSQYSVVARNQKPPPGPAIASVAPVASFEALRSRLDELELGVEERMAELEQRIDELMTGLDSEQAEREELAGALQGAQEEVFELRDRIDEIEAQLV